MINPVATITQRVPNGVTPRHGLTRPKNSAINLGEGLPSPDTPVHLFNRFNTGEPAGTAGSGGDGGTGGPEVGGEESR